MQDIKIVEYSHSYAEAVAKMWNMSGKNWGGEEVVRTAEDIINENDTMGNICAFIALDGGEVAGYCSFGEYKQDEGASYIPLLNVRPDYIGKKIGKKLVLECVKMAINAKWPRLDLYTWQGNDKAVPLYKKCGFFWERRDDSTHLMNFIPYVFKTEAVKHYFDELDWYNDSIREIKIESDGRTDGDFDYYDYIWKKDDINLRIEFERKGRGLTCIDTDDYMVRARVQKQNLVFGRKYEIQYEIINKSQKPLEIAIKGQDDKNIRFDYAFEGNITDHENVIGKFLVDPIDEEQSIWKTHPCVTSEITINGKKASFKVGIDPKFPVKLAMSHLNKPQSVGKESECYINIQNNFDEDISLEFKLMDSDFVSFNKPTVKCNLKAKEKVSKVFGYSLVSNGFYDEEVIINIKTANEDIAFKTKVTGALRGYQGRYYGTDDEGWYIYNGQFAMKLRKRDNIVSIDKIGHPNDDDIALKAPQLGKPFSLEFYNKQPDSVSFDVREDSVRLKAVYRSKTFKGIVLNYFIELYQDGLAQIHYEVENSSNSYTYNAVYVNQQVFNLIINGYIPYDGKIIKSPGSDGLIANRWDYRKIDQNWVFCDNDLTCLTTGLGWSSNCQMTLNQVYFMIENNLGKIEPNARVQSEPITIAYGTFDKWQDFSKYMGNEVKQNSLASMKQSFECTINDGNPIVDERLTVSFKENQKIPLTGSACIQSTSGSFEELNQPLVVHENERSAIDITLEARNEMDIVNVQADLNYRTIKRNRAVFFKGANEIICNESVKDGMQVLESFNGVLGIKASPEYANGIFSLEHKGYQWLNNSFPTPSIKGWWNYWTGGIACKPSGMTYASIQKEARKAEFVSIDDNFGNKWSGIKTTLDIKENEEYKGLQLDEYFLMVPNVPILCMMAVIKQNTGKHLSNSSFVNYVFVNAGDQLEKNWIIFKDDNGEEIKYKCVDSEFDVLTEDYMIHGSEDTAYKMIRIVNDANPVAFFNSNGVAWGNNNNRITAPDQSVSRVNPSFIVFSEQDLDKTMLEDLTKLTFEV